MAAAVALVGCSSPSEAPARPTSATTGHHPLGRDAFRWNVAFTTGTTIQNGFGVRIKPRADLTGTVHVESTSANGAVRVFWLMALLNGVESPVLTAGRVPVVTVRGAGDVTLRVPARVMARGAHRLTMVLVDAEADDSAARRPPFETRTLTYDIEAGSSEPPEIATYRPPHPHLLPGVGPLPPFLVLDPKSTYLKTRYEPGAKPLYAKVGTPDHQVTHYVALIVDGRQHEWVAGHPGLLQVDAPARSALVQPLPLADLAPGLHRIAVVTVPNLHATFFQRRASDIGGRTFLVSTQ